MSRGWLPPGFFRVPHMPQPSQQVPGGIHGLGPESTLAGLAGHPRVAQFTQQAMPRPPDQTAAATKQTWFVMVVDPARRSTRGFKLLEVFGAMRLDNSCSAIEWRRTELGGISFDSQTFVKANTLPAHLSLGTDLWVPVRTVRGKMRGPVSDVAFLMVEQEQDMVAQLYEAGSALLGASGSHSSARPYTVSGHNVGVGGRQTLEHVAQHA
eukprot:3928194-Rhodomonas_salina.1